MPVVGRSVRCDGCAVGKQLTRVVEDDDAIAEQAPPLLRMADDSMGRLAVRR
jgi:hypothetical protein